MVKDVSQAELRPQRPSENRSQRIFFSIFLPLGVVANVALGVVIISGLDPQDWTNFKWLQVGVGALCCVIGGWLAAAAWSKSYWTRNMARQVAVWRGIADAFFVWLEDAPVPAESLHGLKTSLDEVVPNSKQR